MQSPTLGIVIANFNHSHYIGGMLEALLQQSLQPQEIIVMDDGSTDDSVSVITEFTRRNSAVRLLQNSQNMGVTYSYNRGLENLSCDYVGLYAADDIVLSGFFEKSMAVLNKHPHAGLCFSDPAQYFESNKTIQKNSLGWSREACYFAPDELAEVIDGWYIAGHTVIGKTQAALEAGGYLPELRWHCDWFLWHVVAARYGACYIPEPLALFRVREGSMSVTGRENRALQSRVLDSVLRLLKSPEFHDTLPFFVRGSLMSHFQSETVRLALSKPEHWDMETLMLLQNPLWNWNKELAELGKERQRRFEREAVKWEG